MSSISKTGSISKTDSADRDGWGDPPLGDVIARLLRERWSVPLCDRIAVDVDEVKRSVCVSLHSGRDQIRIVVTYQKGGMGRDPWLLMVDAVDELFGMLEEAGRCHRTLPAGTDIEYAGASFSVEVERRVPELEKLADHMLTQSDDNEPRGM